ncbi:hypothetical protein COMNV_00608 [Commensalibacter sp. Nvir]|nr:hypothetical protein COMNV_00608 [Commensalibacter sp. Nvir]
MSLRACNALLSKFMFGRSRFILNCFNISLPAPKVSLSPFAETEPIPSAALPVAEAIDPIVFPTMPTMLPAEINPNTVAMTKEVAQTNTPCIMPSYPAKRPAMKAPQTRLIITDTIHQTITRV